jgi:hypothetical protein
LFMGSREDEVSVRGFLRELRWIAPFVLLTLLGFWGVDVVRGGSSIPLWMVLLGWVCFTVSLGPIIWVRGLPSRARGFWRAWGLALLWFIGCLVLFGVVYGVVVWMFGPP